MHDVSARYGFDEEAGNFQQTNYSGAGRGGDPVLAEAQDGSFVLNANFATPPDGRSGRMQMFLWVDAFRDLGGDVARVHSHQVRDGDVDAGVIAHEYGHGISNRLVGGPSNVDCLRTHDERQGEGWSDWWSYALTMRPGDDGETPRGIGNYVVYYDQGRQGPGIRITPYSTDMDVNPTTYDTIRTAAEPHGVGYVWATYLWDLYWALVDAHGFNPNPYESWDTGGNNLALQLVVDGMKMAVCQPGFVDARDAIIAADAALTGDGVRGENFCLIWEVFARRGLGVDADQGDPASKVDGTEGYEVPTSCA
jgi:extracellular elastinolytic metalloproteinase